MEFDKEKNDAPDLNIVIGGNRFGKTNLLNAIFWALFGEETEKNIEKSSLIKNERYPDESLVVSLDIENQDERERIKRTDSAGLLLIKKDKNTKKNIPSNTPEIDIKNIIPKSVRKFFLFKGEFLDNFFEDQSENILKDTILKVSNLDKLLKINYVLELLEAGYRNEISKKNKKNRELENINNRIKEIEEITKPHKERLTRLEYKIKEVKQKIEDINKSLRNLDVERINLLLDKENELRLSEEKYSKDIEELRKELKLIFLNEISFWFLFSGIFLLKNELDRLEKEGLIPPPISPQIVSKILQEGKCICGRELTPEVENELQELLKNISENKSASEQLYKLNLSLYANKKDFDSLASKINGLLNKKFEYETKLTEIRKNIKDISEDLKNINKEDVNKLQIERETLEKNLEKLETEKVEVSADLRNYETERQFLLADFNKRSSSIGGTELLNKKLQLSSSLRGKIQGVFDEILVNVVNELNKKTKECFKEMFWDNIRFINYDIKLNNNFELEVISPEENNMIKYLSTGEKKVLALSFMTALIDFYGFDFPLVIDAPFTALQKEVMTKVVDTLLTISKRKQVIIFTIRPEEDIMDKLTKSANRIYELKKDDKDNTIVEVIK
jgi:DNA sulfur modification protein DndD